MHINIRKDFYRLTRLVKKLFTLFKLTIADESLYLVSGIKIPTRRQLLSTMMKKDFLPIHIMGILQKVWKSDVDCDENIQIVEEVENLDTSSMSIECSRRPKVLYTK